MVENYHQQKKKKNAGIFGLTSKRIYNFDTVTNKDTNSMSRESDDNLSSINSTYTDMYQDTVKRFTRSSLSPEMERYSLSPSRSSKSTSTSHKSDAANDPRRTSFDLYLEATGRRRSSDHGAVLTVDTEQFIIGQHVWVGGIRPGQIAYIGETHFAPGDWAGIVLDEPNGKNDGCVAGKRYFQCEPKRGIFSRLTRLTMSQLPGTPLTPTSPLSKMSPDRSRTVSPTASIRSSFMRSPGKNGLIVGDRVIVSSGFGSRPGILRYLGETQFASGNWCGIELDEGTGKNDGSVDGIRYFECKPKFGVFVPIAKVSLSPSTKKTRLSRTGSRESLTSIGTMNSIATTNTSRMRMSAQRKPSSVKPLVATPKSQFSMQDLLREKQNHIEQLMIERDLDREDSQTSALQFQKNISELKSRITQLERQLEDERKKSEDLQFSIDEATFCGDELNAQTQVYKEKIHDLERKITNISSGAPSLQITSDPDNSQVANVAALEAAHNVRIAELSAKLQEQAKAYESRISEIQDEEKRLMENIKYLQTENETLQKELLDKDESLEKFSLSESGIDNLRRELMLIKDDNEKERQQTKADFMEKFEEKEALIKRLTEELGTMKNSLGTLESERSNVEDECEILRSECKSRNEELQSLNEQVAKLSAELSMQKAESSTLDEMLKVQQQGSAEWKTDLEAKIAEVSILKEEINGLLNIKSSMETHIQTAADALKAQSELQKDVESKLQAAIRADEEKQEAMKKLETVMEELKQQVSLTNADNEKLNKETKSLSEANCNVKTIEQQLRKELEEKEKLNVTCANELKSTKDLALKLQAEVVCLQQQSGQEISNKAKEIEDLKNGIRLLREKTATLEGESTTNVREMSGKITELEAHIKQLKETLKKGEDAIAWQHKEQAKKENIIAEKVAELKTTTIELESANNLFGQLKKEHDNVSAKCKDLEELLKKNDEKCAQQQLELGDITRRFETLNVKCENLMAQNEVLQQDILAARTTGSEAQAEVKKLNEEIAVKQKAYADLQGASNEKSLKLESQIEELNQKLTNATNSFDDLKEVLHKTKEDLAKKNEHATGLEEKMVKQELSLSDAARQQENLQIKIESLAKQNESLQNDLTTVRTTSTDSNAELVKLSQDVAAKQKAYEELLDKTSAERAALEGQLEASQQRINALCLQVEMLTQELRNTTAESFQRFELLKQAQEKCGKQELDLSDCVRKLETLTTKCERLESQNENLQKDLSSLHTTSTDSNAEAVKLTEELSNKQKALHELADKTGAERLQLESQLQELTQQLQASQSEKASLCDDLKSALEEKSARTEEFESFKSELSSQSHSTLEQVKAIEFAERKRLIENFEMQMKSSDQTKVKLDEAISSLQNQIKLLQDELMKSQLDFKAKEEDLNNQIGTFTTQKEQLRNALMQMETESTKKLSHEQQEKTELLQTVQKLVEELRIKEEILQTMTTEAEQFQKSQTTTSEDLAKLETELKSLRTSLELSNTEVDHKTKLAEEDKKKIEELRGTLEVLQTFNANISATNSELSEALQVLEHEKCETANIFELFEMESDQNAVKLIEKLTELKHQLVDTKTQVEQKDAALAESQKSMTDIRAELEESQSALAEVQAKMLEQTTKLNELNQANEELKKSIAEKDLEIKKREEIELQLAEFKQVVDEMDDAATAKTSNIEHLQQRIQQLEQENISSLELQKTLKLEYTNLQRKMEMMDLDKTRELVALQGRINELQTISKLNQNGGKGDGVVNLDEGFGDTTAQINFLNSIIADMQKKNDTLKAKIEALEALPTDFTKSNAFDLIAKRKPAPRVFCDICDEFDKHETEDCPLQASDDREYSPTFSGAEANNNDPANKKERKLPEPRKYCESCEIFGHETGECVDECF